MSQQRTTSAPELPPVPTNLRPYLDEIAERLFSGHAAVMVGSGFSKNAQRHSPSTPDFPHWSQLGDRFYEKLHNRRAAAQDRYLSVPKLAHEVEAAVGRPALDQLLRAAIPDRDYEPSPLHTKLLNLPWTDVFTTNYDTLLERACGSVTSQRYDIVVNVDDLVYSATPRIVKLHGTFPSDRPFIITDEDYRRYPHEFAPFVNTVRQALLENTLCLIGFSGDDPNFLQWLGWIHDNLGRRNSPRTYLVGMLGLSDSQKKLLERRNIVSVDMSEYPDISADDHAPALERFFDLLRSRAEEYDIRDWPRGGYSDGPNPNDDHVPQIRELLPAWTAQRRCFPGWIVVPEPRRRALWNATRGWLRNPPTPGSLPQPIDLQFAFELIWRMERAHCPIFDNQVSFIEATLNRYLPADTDISGVSLSETSDTREVTTLTPRDVAEMCDHLLLALLRYYREEGRIEDWDRVREQLQTRTPRITPDHRARFHYELALSALFALDPQLIKQRLEEWPIDEALPFWEAKRAGLLAEIGQLIDARRILEHSLVAIRSKANLKPVTNDYSLVSQESFVMLSLHFVRFSAARQATDVPKLVDIGKQFTERWDSLRQYRCDPWNELEVFERALDRPPVNPSHITEKPAFDIGRITRTSHFGGNDREALTAFGFLRFCEDAGLPFRIPGHDIATTSATGALSRIASYSPYWATATLARIGSDKAVDRMFNRASLAGMDTTSVDRLADRYLQSLDRAIPDLRAKKHHWDENFGTVLASVLPEILSRLSSRCSRAMCERLFTFLIDAYRSDRNADYQGVKALTERLLQAASLDQRTDLVSRLLEFPIVSHVNIIAQREYVNPFTFLETWGDTVSGKRTITDQHLGSFLTGASSEDEHIRRWATLTLGMLHTWRLLDVPTTEQFADALWGRVDAHGLPSGTDYFPHAFLGLPHPKTINPADVFRNWVRHQRFPVQSDATSVRMERSTTLCDAIIGAREDVEWSNEEVRSIVSRLVSWWDSDKKWLSDTRSDGSIVDEFGRRFSRLIDTLVAFIIPTFNPTNDHETKAHLERLSRELSEHRMPAVRLEIACIHLFSDKKDAALQRIEDSLASSIDDTVVDALRATSAVSERIGVDGTILEREDLVRILEAVAQMLRWRRETALQLAIDTVAAVARRHPWSLSGTVERAVLDGLHHMVGDSAIQAPDSSRLGGSTDADDVSTKLIVRCAAARLSFALYEHYQKQGTDVPEAVRKWESICGCDGEFAEIRSQWMG